MVKQNVSIRRTGWSSLATLPKRPTATRLPWLAGWLTSWGYSQLSRGWPSACPFAIRVVLMAVKLKNKEEREHFPPPVGAAAKQVGTQIDG